MSASMEKPKQGYFAQVKETIHRAAALPRQFYLVLVLEFFNSFRTVGLRFVLYNFISNEYHFSDKHTGAILGLKGILDLVFSASGSILVDLIGVRNTSIFALFMGIIGRTLFTFSTSTTALYLALFFFSPCGEAFLGTGLYRVAIKKLTTPRIRHFAFGIAYAVNNLAGVVADSLITLTRTGSDVVVFGMVFTATRKFLIVTYVSMILTFLIAFFGLRDLTVASDQDPEEGVVIPHSATDATSSCDCCFGSQNHFEYKVYETHNGSQDIQITLETSNQNRDGTHASSGVNTINVIGESIWWGFQQIKSLLLYANTWRLLIFGFLVVPIGMQWMASDLIMPAFLERHYGEDVPIYMIQSINFAGCLVLPPMISAITTHLDDFYVILPGLWVMAFSPLLIVFMPNILGASLWQMTLTIGEVFWSPRILSWTARLAPTGKEGLFFALVTTRALVGPATDYFLGYLNSVYNPNCPQCRDEFGHFCSTPYELPLNVTHSGSGLIQCGSQEGPCRNDLTYNLGNNGTGVCPNSCMDCPGWESNAHKLWSIILFLSISSPMAVWLLLPFLQGSRGFHEGCYGIFECGFHRILNIFGYNSNPSPKVYKPVRKDTSEDSQSILAAIKRSNARRHQLDHYEDILKS